jgi:hemerythrin-like domain-containing protein
MTTTSSAPAPAFAVTPRRAGEPEADLFSFVLIHRAIRSGTRQLADAATGIANGQPCSRERQRAIVQMALAVLCEITNHHEREDDVLWPVICAAVLGSDDGSATAVELADLSDDHVELHRVIARAERALPQFARDPRTGAAEFGALMTEMADLLDEHIGEEEREVFPVIRAHVSAPDFARCEALFRKGTSIGQLAFLLPWVADQCTPEERTELLAEAGRPLAVLLRLTEGRYLRRRDLVSRVP